MGILIKKKKRKKGIIKTRKWEKREAYVGFDAQGSQMSQTTGNFFVEGYEGSLNNTDHDEPRAKFSGLRVDNTETPGACLPSQTCLSTFALMMFSAHKRIKLFVFTDAT